MALDDHFGARKRRKPHGTEAEKKTAKRLGGDLRPGSGSLDGAKGDVRTKTFLIENKSTICASIGIKHEWLTKISREATEIGERPAVAIQFVDKMGNSEPDDRWIMVREIDYQELINGE